MSTKRIALALALMLLAAVGVLTVAAAETPAPAQVAVLAPLRVDGNYGGNFSFPVVEAVRLDCGGLYSMMQPGQASVLFDVTNIRDLPASVDVIIERGTFPSTGTLTLEFSHDLFTRWHDASAKVEGGAVVPDTSQIEITDPVSATILGLPMGIRETQKAKLHLSGPPAAEFALRVSERIEGSVIGGMTYRTEIPWTFYLPLVLKSAAPVSWDPRLDALGITLEPAPVAPGEPHWRLIHARWADAGESAGAHSIFINLLNSDNRPAWGQPLGVKWPGGSINVITEDVPGREWGAKFPMYNTLGTYSVRVDDGLPSDRIVGLGLGTAEQPNYTIHTSFYLTFRKVE